MYTSLLIVPSVPIIPILLFLVVRCAVLAPGFTTPIIGMDISFFIVSKASAEAVLQAITIALTSCFRRKCVI